MKTILTFCFIITFHFSAFAQIDTTAWEGKTVLVIQKPISGQYGDYKDYFNTHWYLTDSVIIVRDTLLNRSLDSFGKDTVVVIYEQEWFMFRANKNCAPSYDCWIPSLGETIEFKNFQTEKWEQFVFMSHNTIFPKLSFIVSFQEIITKLKSESNNHSLQDVFFNKNEQLKKNYKYPFHYAYKFDDDIFAYYKIDKNTFVYRSKYPSSNYIEFIDLKTNRVIEKIKIE